MSEFEKIQELEQKPQPTVRMLSIASPREQDEAAKIIEQAILLMDDHDNQAKTIDGVGWGKTDVKFGKSLARQIRQGRNLTPGQLHPALRMLEKYAHTQLRDANIRLPHPGQLPAINPAHFARPRQPPTTGKTTALKIGDGDGKTRIKIGNGGLLVNFGFNASYFDSTKVERIKASVPQTKRRFDPPTGNWIVALEYFDQLIELFPDAMIDDGVAMRAHEYTARLKENLEASSAVTVDLKVDGFGLNPFPFQYAGAAYLVRNPRAFLADEPGLGKTLQTLLVAEHEHAYPVLVVCPASLKLNWKKEIAKCLPKRRVIVCDTKTNAAMMAYGDIVVINYDILSKMRPLLETVKFKMIAYDESHRLKTPKTLRTKAATELTANVNPGYVYMLTGTPLVNRPEELLTQLAILGVLDKLGGWWGVATRYMGYVKGSGFPALPADDPRLKALNTILRQNCFIRRLKEHVLPELPPRIYSAVPLEIDNRAEYAALENAPLDVTPGAHLKRIEELKQLAVKGKMRAAVSWINEFLESGNKLVVFSWHRETSLEMSRVFTERLGYRVDHVIGGMDQRAISAAVDRFQNDPSAKLIAMNIQSGGVGLTLTAASNVCFLENAWTPGDMDQAADRCHRIGQQDTVNIYNLIAEGTIDEHIYDIFTRKRSVVDAATEGMLREDEQRYALCEEILERIKEKKE